MIARSSGITYYFPGANDPALLDAVFDIPEGLTLLTGPSGSGKSTLLRVLNGLIPHHHGGRFRGAASVAGLPVPGTPPHVLARRVGFVFQDPEAGFIQPTVEREVAFGLENLAVAPDAARVQVGEALDRLRIHHLRQRRLDTLSGGERQRVALAAALAVRPLLVAMDEPASQLDAESTSDLVGACNDLVASGTSIVVAEHRPEPFGMADVELQMHDGRVATGAASRRRPIEESEVGVVASAGGREKPVSAGEAWRLDRVTFGFNGTPVIEGLTASGRAGEVVALTGRNGSGKTTALRLIAGALRPAAGSVDRAAGRVAYLPQDPTSLLHRPTVREETELTLRLSGDNGSGDGILRRLGLVDVAERYPRDISTGQKQRAALAAILVGSPHLALLDEPTRGMDDAARRALATIVRDLARDGGAVVLATHDVDLINAVADRVINLDDAGPHSLALVS